MRNTRIPVIALPYTQKHKAVKKELVVDYDNGKLYVVSAQDSSVLFDITDNIKKQIEIGNINVNIEGIGEVNLEQYLKGIQHKIDSTVLVEEIGINDIFIHKDERLDEVSLESSYRQIQVKGFNSADNYTVPQKYNGSIRWIVPNGFITDNDGTGQNPNNGLTNKVYLIEQLNSKIYLNASKRQMSLRLEENVEVIMPIVLDRFCEIYWCIRTYSITPNIFYNTKKNNVLFKSGSESMLQPNCYHVLKYTTWDNGVNWLLEIDRYPCQ